MCPNTLLTSVQEPISRCEDVGDIIEHGQGLVNYYLCRVAKILQLTNTYVVSRGINLVVLIWLWSA